ncbi:hypothetical protein [Burkholderia gladioli]|uniref:hypothetical protein n=1 Tax=Burkholderia gladioli TaxID=28095 RepID=UPI00249F1916|nr:hypothetical protein [Burkholderia gladioli]
MAGISGLMGKSRYGVTTGLPRLTTEKTVAFSDREKLQRSEVEIVLEPERWLLVLVARTVNQKLGGVAALHPARRPTAPRPRVTGRGIAIFDLGLVELETSAPRQIDNANAVLLHQLSNLGERQLALVRESFVHFPLDCVAFSDEFLISLGWHYLPHVPLMVNRYEPPDGHLARFCLYQPALFG